MARDDVRGAPSAAPPLRWQSHPRGHAPAPRLDPSRESGPGSARHAREVPTVLGPDARSEVSGARMATRRALRGQAGRLVLDTTMLPAGTRSCASGPRVGSSPSVHDPAQVWTRSARVGARPEPGPVLGSSGHGRLGRRILASTSLQLTREARCPL